MANPSVFFLAVLLLLATPGPTNTLLWSSGAVLGVRRAMVLQVGELLGYWCAIALIVVVFEPLIDRVPVLQQVLSVAVAVYIGYLAYKVWHQPTDRVGAADAIGARKVFIVTLLNPKAFVFALTILPLGHPQLHWYCLALAGCIFTAGFCWIVVGYLLGSRVGRKKLVLFNRCSSVILGGFSGYMMMLALA